MVAVLKRRMLSSNGNEHCQHEHEYPVDAYDIQPSFRPEVIAAKLWQRIPLSADDRETVAAYYDHYLTVSDNLMFSSSTGFDSEVVAPDVDDQLLTVYINSLLWTDEDDKTRGCAMLELMVDFIIWCNRLPWQAQSSTTIAQLSRRFNKAIATIVKANGLPFPGHPRRVHVLSSFGLGNVNGITARPMLKFPDLVCSVFVAWSGKETVDWKSHRKPLTDLTFPFHLPRIGDTCRSIPPRITTLITDCTD